MRKKILQIFLCAVVSGAYAQTDTVDSQTTPFNYVPLPADESTVASVPFPVQETSAEPQPLPLSPEVVPTAADESSTYASAAFTRTPHSYSSCHVEGRYIALTFDDGPDPSNTPRLLDILKERNVPATFFVLGTNATAYPGVLRRAAAEGHEIASHSWNHPRLNSKRTDVAYQLNKTSEAIRAATGKAPTLMRPPYGATSAALNKIIDEKYGMKVILWSVDPLDWKYRNSARVCAQLVANAQPGGILLVHDIHKTTVDAMPDTIDQLLAKGYKFVTVSELIAMDRPRPPKPPKTTQIKSPTDDTPKIKTPKKSTKSKSSKKNKKSSQKKKSKR